MRRSSRTYWLRSGSDVRKLGLHSAKGCVLGSIPKLPAVPSERPLQGAGRYRHETACCKARLHLKGSLHPQPALMDKAAQGSIMASWAGFTVQ